jgi:hypothetical protein
VEAARARQDRTTAVVAGLFGLFEGKSTRSPKFSDSGNLPTGKAVIGERSLEAEAVLKKAANSCSSKWNYSCMLRFLKLSKV